MKKILITIIAIVSSCSFAFSQEYKASDIEGIWLNEDEDAKVEITKKGDKYFGKVIWIKDPIDEETGKPKKDKHNPDEKLRDRPSLGLEILTNFKFDGDDEWDDGKIYDPKCGKTYSCYMRMLDKDKIKIRGYIGFSLLGRTTYWTRSTI